MWTAATEIPLNAFILFFGVWMFVALLAIVKVRTDAKAAKRIKLPPATSTSLGGNRRTFAEWLQRPIAFLFGLVFAAAGAFVTCVALNYKSMHPSPVSAVQDNRTYRVIDRETGEEKVMNGRWAKDLYGEDLLEDGTRMSDKGKKTFGAQMADQIRAHEAEQAQPHDSEDAK